ncbi:M18 family aminopeptidase [Neptuniibacter sp.]|uniref:M18 family aminopeptidase n=1 Tax=Neptuniibacter sp. TaxID=1962643 RepID=UPI0026238CB1|nr:M18 family aminopeptidase [Neptuniibacter sp.]MCP4596092.1 M18 family aminopeptidase [Neptuniibacter sp.]
MTDFIDGLKSFLANSPTPFHAVKEMELRLQSAGFEFLSELDSWNLEAGGKYFTTRNDSSIVAWIMPAKQSLVESGLRMVGAHTDSPCLKVKPQPEIHKHGYNQLGVEVYGGVLLNPWFDRDLSMAGRVSYLSKEGQLSRALVNFKDPIAVIPSLAIHLDREANKSRSINAQTYLPVILGQSEDKADFKQILKAQLEQEGVRDLEEILDYEISLYDTQPPAVTGLNQEFIASARLDNLLSCYMGLVAMIESDTEQGALLVCNDHEEVGSMSAAGAQGPMLAQVLDRLVPDAEQRVQMLARSMMISADNAHGIHPNFADKHDANHGPLLNAGPVIKINANQRYASNSETSALFRHIAKQVDVPVQAFVVRSDMACGSTIGPITAAELGVKTLDIGVPQFAMHSIREMAGTKDVQDLTKVLSSFFGQEQT